MGFRVDLKFIEQWRATLDKLAENYIKNEVTILSSNDPKYLRWHLSQALFSARELDISPYNKIFFRFKKVGAKIYAYPRPISEAVQAETAQKEATAKAIPGVSSMLALVQAAMKEKGNLLSFPDLEPTLLDTAKKWAATMNHEIISEDPFTIQKKQ